MSIQYDIVLCLTEANSSNQSVVTDMLTVWLWLSHVFSAALDAENN